MLNATTGIFVAQMSSTPANLRANLQKMLSIIETAKATGASLVVFPELATSGYVLGDRWENDEFIAEIEEVNDAIRRASAHRRPFTVIWGSIMAHWHEIGEDGRVRKFNAAFIASNGEWLHNGALRGWIPKTNLPKYRIFDDARHFYPAEKLATQMGLKLEELLKPFYVWVGDVGYNIALTVCEDLWEDEYATKPSRIYAKQDVDLMVDISCSPWTFEKWKARERMLRNRVADSGVPILYVNAVGLENNTKNLIWFDGDSAYINEQGEFLWRGTQHKESLFMVRFGALSKPLKPRESTGITEIYQALIAGIQVFFEPFDRVIIGLSGGIDSAVMAALLAKALGPAKVLAFNMPTQFNSKTTKNLALECAANLRIDYRIESIQPLYEEHLQTLRRFGYANPKSITRENIQARIRSASILAAIAQEENGAFTCNGNKTEMALNYFTLYGDGAGAAAFLADLWKEQIYELARLINEQEGSELIPAGIIQVVPSAELSDEQAVDEGKGDPIFFPYHDKLLRAFTEWRWDPTTVLTYACTGQLEAKLQCAPGVLRKYFKNRTDFIENLEWAWRQYSREFKRGQTPPVFMTSRRAFGFDRRDTIREAYFTDDYYRLREEYLLGDNVSL